MPSQRFAVLKTGSTYREIRTRLGDFDRMFLDLLAEPGQVWDVYNVEHSDFPKDVSLYDGFVITGSPACAYDDLPWIKTLFNLVRSSHAAGQTLLGICFGHQVLAQALGGDVRPNPQGWDVGLRELQLAPGASHIPELASSPRPLRVLELHQDAVLRLPPGATLLASSGHTACEMFSLGSRTLGIQGHPEFDVGVIQVALAKLRGAGLIDEQREQWGAASLTPGPDQGFFREWLRGFMQRSSLTHAA